MLFLKRIPSQLSSKSQLQVLLFVKDVIYFPKMYLLLTLCNLRIFRSSRWRCFVGKGVPKNFARFTRKHLFLRPATLFKKRPQHRCFPVNFAKFLGTPFLQKHLQATAFELGNGNYLEIIQRINYLILWPLVLWLEDPGNQVMHYYLFLFSSVKENWRFTVS